MAERLKYAADAFVLSYARIFFSGSKLLGLCILASTMVIPSHGIFGILGAVFSNLSAYVIGMDRNSIRKGYYGFNGVLTGLGLGFFYNISIQSIFILFAILIILTFVTIFMNSVSTTYLGLPAMSMPFNVVTWLLIFASFGFGYLHLSYNRWEVLQVPLKCLPHWANVFFISFGAVLFQINTLSGIIIAIGLLFYSRIAFILMGAGFLFATWMHGFLGADESLINVNYLGFNYMLVALAMGAVFVVPGPGSFLLAMVSVALSVIILVGTTSLFPNYVSPLALPFNIAVLIVLYGLKVRMYPSMGISLVSGEIGSPEENLCRFREDRKQWRHWGIPIALPFHGSWQVSQGIDGEYTHKDKWRFAYDFQAVDSQGKIYKNIGTALEDYYAYGLPITSPAGGKVVIVRDGVADNPVGKVNTIENWGNHVIIEHAPNFYSCIAHLKEGTLKVAAGQDVKKGEVLALCGNSGRSPYPHVHLQFQAIANVGAASIQFELSNILILEGLKKTYLPKGVIEEKKIVQNMVYHADFDRFFPYTMHGGWVYKFKGTTGIDEIEFWRLDADFYGNTFLISSPKETKLYFQFLEGVLSLKKIEGRRDTGLFFLGSVLSDLPLLQSNDKAIWEVLDDTDYVIAPLYTRLIDVFALLGFALKQRIQCVVTSVDDEVILYRNPELCMKTPLGIIHLKNMPEATVVWRKNSGVNVVRSGRHELTIVTA